LSDTSISAAFSRMRSNSSAARADDAVSPASATIPASIAQ